MFGIEIAPGKAQRILFPNPLLQVSKTPHQTPSSLFLQLVIVLGDDGSFLPGTFQLPGEDGTIDKGSDSSCLQNVFLGAHF